MAPPSVMNLVTARATLPPSVALPTTRARSSFLPAARFSPATTNTATARSRGTRRSHRRYATEVQTSAPVAPAAEDDASEDVGPVVRLRSEADVDELLDACKGQRRKCVINVSTSSCGPCKFLLPTLEKYAEEHLKRASFGKIISDENDELKKLVTSWGVSQVPCYRFYDENGALYKQFTTGDPKKLGSALYLFLS